VQSFAGEAPQSDDITLLALRYLRDGGTEGEA
jgi:serine phosphatase RsbU (regulator of sigma subunit)